MRFVLATMLVAMAACAVDLDADGDGEDATDEELMLEDVESAVTGSFVLDEATAHASRFNPHRRNHVDRRALDRRRCLNDIARRRARRMADGQCPGSDSICHFGGLGDAVENACPFDWAAIGENVGVGASERSLWTAFLGSAPHHANIDGRYNRFGVGAFRRASDDALFIVHVFVRTP